MTTREKKAKEAFMQLVETMQEEELITFLPWVEFKISEFKILKSVSRDDKLFSNYFSSMRKSILKPPTTPNVKAVKPEDYALDFSLTPPRTGCATPSAGDNGPQASTSDEQVTSSAETYSDPIGGGGLLSELRNDTSDPHPVQLSRAEEKPAIGIQFIQYMQSKGAPVPLSMVAMPSFSNYCNVPDTSSPSPVDSPPDLKYLQQSLMSADKQRRKGSSRHSIQSRYYRMVRDAIRSAPNKMATTTMIYDYIVKHHGCDVAGKVDGSWKSTVRHVLAFHKGIERVNAGSQRKNLYTLSNDIINDLLDEQKEDQKEEPITVEVPPVSADDVIPMEETPSPVEEV